MLLRHRVLSQQSKCLNYWTQNESFTLNIYIFILNNICLIMLLESLKIFMIIEIKNLWFCPFSANIHGYVSHDLNYCVIRYKLLRWTFPFLRLTKNMNCLWYILLKCWTFWVSDLWSNSGLLKIARSEWLKIS